MSILETIVLAIVEGLTEFLPVSSTGHMIVAQGIMHMESTEYLRAFTVMVQFGAILSVVVLYWRKFFTTQGAISIVGEKRPDTKSAQNIPSVIRFYLLIVIGCIPAAVIGLLLNDYIDKLLSDVTIVAAMLVAGGVFMIFIDKLFTHSYNSIVKPHNAFVVGLFQCIAMIPGVSRSMATIAGGLQQGLNRKTAAEFSFFLAVPTMLGATLLKAYKLYKQFGVAVFEQNATTLILGNIIAFIVAMLAIKFFIQFLTKYGFKAFGWYRIFAGATILILMASGVNLTLN